MAAFKTVFTIQAETVVLEDLNQLTLPQNQYNEPNPKHSSTQFRTHLPGVAFGTSHQSHV